MVRYIFKIVFVDRGEEALWRGSTDIAYAGRSVGQCELIEAHDIEEAAARISTSIIKLRDRYRMVARFLVIGRRVSTPGDHQDRCQSQGESRGHVLTVERGQRMLGAGRSQLDLPERQGGDVPYDAGWHHARLACEPQSRE